MRLADELRCQRILWQESKSFAAASLLLPPRLRGPVAAVYSFCRISDDEVDTPQAGHAALHRLRERLDRAYRGRPQDHPVDRGFSETTRRYGIPREVPEALFEGFQWDLDGRAYETLGDLRSYCARVASTVGVMMTLLMERRDRTTLARACDLGAAMQLTNIARDVGEDARNGRLYLPRSWLRDEHLDPEAWLSEPHFSPAVGRLVERLLKEAETLYLRSERGIPRLPRDCRVSIASARYIYGDIGRAIRQQGYDSVGQRAFVTRGRKLRLMASALPWIWSAPGPDPDPPLPETKFLVDAV